MPAEQDVQTRDWKSRAAEWLFSQGVSTVLLFAIFAIAVYAVRTLVPMHLNQIQEGYERVGDDLKSVADKFDKDQDRDQQLLMKLLDRQETRHEKERAEFKAGK